MSPLNKEIHVINFASNTVSAISGSTNKVVKTITGGSDPIDIIVT